MRQNGSLSAVSREKLKVTADPLGAITPESEGHREYRCSHTTGLKHSLLVVSNIIMDSGSDSSSRHSIHLCFEIWTSCYQRDASHTKNETRDELKILYYIVMSTAATRRHSADDVQPASIMPSSQTY